MRVSAPKPFPVRSGQAQANSKEGFVSFVIYRLIYNKENPHLSQVAYVSPSISHILGSANIADIPKWFESIHPDDREAVLKANIQAFKTRQFDETFRFYHAQRGQYRWVRAVSTFVAPSSSENEIPDDPEVIGLALDVTEQKELEISLLESSERLKSIARTVPDVIFEFDLEGKLTFCSDAVEKLLGYSVESLLGKNLSELISQRNLTFATEAFDSVMKGEPVTNLHLDLLRRDGSKVPGNISAGPLVVKEKIIGLQGIVRDFSVQKQTESVLLQNQERLQTKVNEQSRELIEREARYRGIVEKSPDLICRFLPDGVITFANQAWRNYLENPLGQNFFAWNALDGNMRAMKKKITTSFQKPFAFYTQTRIRTKDGSIRWILWTGQKLSHEENGATEYQAVGHDITQQKNGEIEKRKIEKLQRQSQKLEALGTLSAGIAHDFNNILAVLLGNVQLAIDDVLPESRARKNIDEMIKAIVHARDMVKQILTFCRKGEQMIRPLSLTPVIKECVKFLRSAIPSLIDIHENIAQTDTVNADPTQISQVIMNLGSNAAHAMGGQAGRIEIALEPIQITSEHPDRLRVSDEGAYVKLTFADTGCGIPPELLSRIFDPYFSTKEEGEGSGMGLAVVHGIIKAHGGVIWVNSDPGKGSVFQMVFPVAQSEIPTENIDTHTAPGGNERILLVDDREKLLNVEKDLLEHLGYKVTAFTNPIEALESFRERPWLFDLVYTDMTMPHMNGLTLSKKLLNIRPDIPVVLYTGLGDLVESDAIEESGVRAFLKKPILLEELASILREVLEHDKRKQ